MFSSREEEGEGEGEEEEEEEEEEEIAKNILAIKLFLHKCKRTIDNNVFADFVANKCPHIIRTMISRIYAHSGLSDIILDNGLRLIRKNIHGMHTDVTSLEKINET